MARKREIKRPPQAKKIQVRNDWLKNVGQSLGMTANEMLGEMMPSTIELGTNTFETATGIYNDLRENRVSGKRIIGALNLEDQWNIGKDALSNAMADIKSGKIYNKERVEGIYSDGDDDFNLEDFDFNDSFDSDDSDISDSSPKIKINAPTIADNKPVVASINAQSGVIANSAEAIIASNRQQASNTMIFNQKHSDLMIRGASAINDNLSLLVNFQTDNMSKYIHASISYYEESLNHLSSTVAELKKITLRAEVAQHEQKPMTNQWDDVLLSYGGLNAKGYMDNVMKNFNTAVDEDLVLSSFKGMISDKDTLKYMAASPLTFISSKIMKNVIPGMLQESLKKFDETMSNFFPSLLLKVTGLGEKHDGNYLWNLVSKVFGINATTKNGIDVSQYKKDEVPFDGVTKKAITEVIPTYLKKILSAISGQEEMTYDYEKGVYKKTIDIKKEFTEEQARRSRSGYSDAISEVKTRSKAYEFTDKDVEEKFQKGIDTFFSKLGKSGKFINPYKDTDEEFNDIFNFDGDSNMQRLFKTIMKTLDRKTLMGLSKGTVDSRQSLTKYFDELEKAGSLSVQQLVSNGIGIDDTLSKDSSGKVTGFVAGAPFNPVDKFKLSSLDYLRRIENILIKGIRVFPQAEMSTSGNLSVSLPYDSSHVNDERRMEKAVHSNTKKNKTYSADDYTKSLNKGIHVLDTSYDLGEEEIMIDNINTYMQINGRDDDHINENQQSNIFKKMAKYLPVDAQGKWNNFSDGILSMIYAPGRMLSGVVDKLDKTLFNMIFGVSEDGQGYSFVQGMIASFKSGIDNMIGFLNDKVFDPLHEVLFGEDGWFTKFKESDMFANMKIKFDGFKDYAFGFKNIDGFREGGMFSDTFNELKDIFKGFGYYFSGKSYTNSKGVAFPDNSESVFGNLKQIAIDSYNSTKQYIFGDSTDENGNKESDKPITTVIKESMINGATNFHKAIFGDDTTTVEHHKAIVEDLTKKVKDNLPKTLAWGTIGAGAGLVASTSGLGLMGSMFLPGGPIGGAVVGMGLNLLTQSDTFMNKVFGAKDENDERVGGLISASTQKFFKENKNVIVGAGVLGALKPALGLGWLPSFILPGGPIGGALMGVAAALTVRSKTFQELMFGTETDVDGKLTGGLLSSFSNKMKSAFGDMQAKNVFGNVGVGALGGAGLALMVGKMGLLGSMLTPFGPMGGAMLGAATGIALSSEKWRKLVFGEIDEETGKREGGALGKLGNWMEHNVMMPMKDTFDDIKVNMYKWFGESIAMPFREALFPIKTEIKYMVESVNDMFSKGWGLIQEGISNTLGKFVIKPFGKFMEDHVMKPLRGFLGLAMKTSMKALQLTLGTPFKLMGIAGGLAERRQERRGKKTYISDLKQAKKDGSINGLEYIQQRFFDRRSMEDAKTAAKVGNAKEMREEAQANGMTFAQYVSSKKKDARSERNANLIDSLLNGETNLTGYLNSRFFDKRSIQRAEDEALGSNTRNEYYDKLDADKAKFRDKVKTAEEERQANKSRRKYLRQLGMDTGYTGFIYEKDKDGNTVEGGTKVSVDRAIEALTMSKSTMSDDQQELINQIGKRLGVKNLLSSYSDNGLDMGDLSKKNRKKLQNGITSGSANDLLRLLAPYTRQEQSGEVDKDNTNTIVDATRESGEMVSERIDKSNKLLDSIKSTVNWITGKSDAGDKDYNSNPNFTLVGDTYDATNSNTDEAKSKESMLPSIIQEPSSNPNFTLVGDAYEKISEQQEKLFGQREREQEDDNKKAEIEENQKEASRKTASFVINENNKKKGLAEFWKNTIHQSDMLTSMNNILGNIFKGMDWVFGKKGVLTALFLATLPFILKWLKDRSNGDAPIERYDANGDRIYNESIIKDLQLGLAKTGNKVAQALLKSPTAAKIASSALGGYNKWVSKLPETLFSGKTASNAVDNMASNILSNNKLLTGNVDDILKITAPKATNGISGDVWSKFIKNEAIELSNNKMALNAPKTWLDDGVELITKSTSVKKAVNNDLVEKLSRNSNIIDVVPVFDKAGNVIYSAKEEGVQSITKLLRDGLEQGINKVVNFTNKTMKTSVSNASKVVDDIMRLVNPRAIMQKFGNLIVGGGKMTIEVLASVFTDPVLVQYGAVTGLFEAERLFKVYKQDVDILMSAISGGIKALMAWKNFFLIEILNEIIADVTDVDIFSIIATFVYKLLSDDTSSISLDLAQLDFKEGVSIYNDKNGTSLTVDSYNDMVNKHLSTELFDGGSAINHRVGENMLTTVSKVTKGALGAFGKDGISGVGNYLTSGVRAVGSTLSKVNSKLPSMVRNANSAVGTTAKNIGSSIIDVVNKADLNRLDTFKKLVANAMDKIGTAVTKAFPKIGNKFTSVASKVTGGLSDKVLAKFLPKITESLASKSLGMALGAVTVGIWTGLEIGVGAISGSTTRSAAQLFRVNQDDVDGIMRTISSIINGILNASWVFVIDILNDIYVAMTDDDFISNLAAMIYDLVSSEEKSIALDNAQIQFETDVKTHNQQNGVSLSVDEYNDEVANASWWTKQRNNKNAKKEEESLRKEAKKHGMDLEEYKEFKKSRLKYDNEGTGDIGNIKASIDSLEAQKEAIIASTDENMYNLRSIITAVGAGLNVTTFEQLAPTLDLTESQMISIREIISTTMYGIDDKTREEMTKSLNVSTEALDGVLATMEATMFGLDETTLDKMGPILNITEENLEGIKWTIEQTLGGMDRATVKNMFESQAITEEQMNNMFTIMDATMNGMNEETLKAIGPLLGITEENMGAVEKLINETMAGINGETNARLSDLNVADPLRQARDTIDNAMSVIRTDSEEAFSGIDINTPLNQAIKNIENGIKEVDTESKGFWSTLQTNVTKWWNTSWLGGLINKTNNTMSSSSTTSTSNPTPTNSLYSTNRSDLAGKGESTQSVNQSGQGEGGKGIEADSMNNFAYYAQTDDRYAGHNYDLSPGLGSTSTPSLKARGCGPTSMAMVATQLTGKKYLPTTLSDMARSWGHSVSAGTSWNFFKKAGSTFSMDTDQNAPSVTGMRSALNAGQPVIISGRNNKYGSSESPFTTGGHFVVGVGTEGNSKIIINDPRGGKYSKAYDISKVANESRQFWKFNYNPGGVLPDPDGTYSPTNTSNNNTSSSGAESEEEDLGTWGAFSKMLEAMGLYVENVTNGTNLTLADKNNSSNSSSSSGTDSSGYTSSYVPTNVQEAILKKTLEMTVANESGGSYTNVVNDKTGDGVSISPSIGIIQMREGNAKDLMQRMYANLPNSSEASYWANYDWNNRSPWSSTQRTRLQNYLSSNLSVTKQVQDEHAMKYIKDRNLSQVYQYGVDAGKFTDPRAIVHLGEIGNTGPANIKKFLSSYSKGSGDEFDHYLSQFKAKSYWGSRSIYNNRINKSYNTLKNWDPKQLLEGGYGEVGLDTLMDSMFGGYGERPVNAMIDNVVKNAKDQKTLMIKGLQSPCDSETNCPSKDLGGKGSTDFTADRMDNIVNELMESVKNRDFDTTDTMEFNPDLSSFNDIGGKGGDKSTLPEDSRTAENTAEIKSLNNNISKMTDKVVAKTPDLLPVNMKDTLAPQTQPSMSEALMLEIINILKGVESNTGDTSSGIGTLASKDLSIEVVNDIQVLKDGNGNVIAVSNNSTNTTNPMYNVTSNTKTDARYVTAKDIAKGRINK